MNVRLESMCQGDGKVYLQMVVERLLPDAVLGVDAHTKDGAQVPALLLPFAPADGRSQANFVVVLPHLGMRELDLDFEEFGAGEDPVSRGHLTVEINTVGWRTRFNTLVRTDLVQQMLDIEHEHCAGRMNVYFVGAIDDGDEIVVKMIVDLPNLEDSDVMVDFLDDAGHGFDIPVHPLLDEVIAARRVGDESRLRIGFSVRVPRDDKNFCVKVYDASDLMEGGFARFDDETYEPLAAAARQSLGDAGEDPDYPLWYHRHRATAAQLDVQRRTSLSFEPLISLVMPLTSTERGMAHACLQALLRQSYDLFEVVIVDSCPQEDSFDGLLEGWEGDPRIVRVPAEEGATDAERWVAGLLAARGSFKGLLDPAVVLAPEALFEFVRCLNEGDALRNDFWVRGWSGDSRGVGLYAPRPAGLGTDAVALFANHDYQDAKGNLSRPVLKPALSPDLLRAHPYVGPFLLMSAGVVDAVAAGPGFAPEGFFHDLVLKVWEAGVPMGRVDQVLYHVQMPKKGDQELLALLEERAERDFRGGRRCVANHLRRIGVEASVVADAEHGRMRIGFRQDATIPVVSVIVIADDDLVALGDCLASLMACERQVPLQLVIVSRATDKKAFNEFYADVVEVHPNTRVVVAASPFVRSAALNQAAMLASGEYLMFVDAQAEFLAATDVATLVGRCQMPGVGVVGPKTLYADDTVRHGGVVIGPAGCAGNIGTDLPRRARGYLGRLVSACDVSAVSCSGMVVSRAAFEAVGGYDERFRMGLCDVDLCLRVQKAGYRVVFEADVELYDHAGTTQGRFDDEDQLLRFEQERAYFRYRWPRYFLKGDPFMSACIDWQSAHFQLSQ